MNGRFLALFLRQQAVYIAGAAIACAILWASGLRVNLATVFVYALCIGNLVTPAIGWLQFLYAERKFPYNLLIFLLILLVLTAPVYLITSVVVWLVAPPAPVTLFNLIAGGWKFSFVFTFLFGVPSFLFFITKERLEQRNVELEQTVERGTAQIALQEQEFERGREIQQSLLPKDIPQLAGFEVAGAWKPARSVSGDYYDVLRLDDHRLGICIADVVGKGVSAALLMANVQAAVRAFASDSESPARVCSKVNILLHENIATGKYVTFLYGILDGKARTFQYCNAGHLYPILITRGFVQTPDSGGAVLGVFPGWNYEDSTIELKAGDRLLLFTDGITEASDATGKEYEETNIAAFAVAHATLPAKDLNSRLLAHVTAFCNGHFRDDATLLVIASD
jgi:sigma-B regulation protein RsbU (phosphoserine phosphatase)